MRCAGRFEHRSVRIDERDHSAICVAPGDRPGLDARPGHPPAVRIPLELQIDDAEVAAAKARHDRRLAMNCSARGVDAGPPGKIIAGKQQVLVAEKQGVDAIDLGEVLACVLLAAHRRQARNAGVAQRDNEIGAAPEFAQLRARAASTMSTVVKRPRTWVSSHCAICGGATPITPTLSPCGAPASSTNLRSITTDGGNQGEPSLRRILPQTTGKPRPGVSALEDLEAVVELMVAKHRGRIVERVHRRDDRMDRLRVFGDRVGGEVAERRALENVAVVEQQAVGRFLASLSDQGRGPGKPDRIVRAVAVIVVRIEIGVQIGQAEQAQAQAGRRACQRGSHVVLARHG